MNHLYNNSRILTLVTRRWISMLYNIFMVQHITKVERLETQSKLFFLVQKNLEQTHSDHLNTGLVCNSNGQPLFGI